MSPSVRPAFWPISRVPTQSVFGGTEWALSKFNQNKALHRSFNVVLRPQRAYGLLATPGTATSTFTQLLSFDQALQSINRNKYCRAAGGSTAANSQAGVPLGRSSCRPKTLHGTSVIVREVTWPTVHPPPRPLPSTHAKLVSKVCQTRYNLFPRNLLGCTRVTALDGRVPFSRTDWRRQGAVEKHLI